MISFLDRREKVDVVILYEHVARELDVECAVKALIEMRHGLQVEILQTTYQGAQAVDQLHPRVVAVPHMYNIHAGGGGAYMHALLRWRDATFVNLAWEQLLYAGNREAKTPRGEFAAKHTIHHAWSDLFADYLQLQGIPSEHIVVNGQPAYTLYKEPYCQYFTQRDELAAHYNLDMHKRWVFFPENYNWAFYNEERAAALIRQGVNPEQLDEMREFCTTSLQAVMEWFQAVASEGNVEIIVRPRPFTPLEEFVSVVKTMIPALAEHIHFIKDYSVREWILASDVVVSSYSTSLIEAAVAQKHTYMLEPVPILPLLVMDWHQYLPHITSQAEFQAICAQSSHADRDTRLSDWATTTLMSQGDAIWHMAELLARVCTGEIAVPSSPTIHSIIPPGKVPPWFLYTYRNIFWWYRRRQAGVKALAARFEKDNVSAEEIAQRTHKWRQLLAGYDPSSETYASMPYAAALAEKA